MRNFAKLPLYLGMAVLVVSVLVSAVKIGNRQAFTSQKTKAGTSGASLILKYTSPNIVSVLLTADKSIKGADISLAFNGDKIQVLPSSLSSGPDFAASGGNIDLKENIFTFSVVTQKKDISAGVLASFNVYPVWGDTAEADLQFPEDANTVIEDSSGQNILTQTQGVKFTTSKK